jgi:hypothetical protein
MLHVFSFALSFLEKKTIVYVSWTLKEEKKTRDDREEEKSRTLNDQCIARTQTKKKRERERQLYALRKTEKKMSTLND